MKYIFYAGLVLAGLALAFFFGLSLSQKEPIHIETLEDASPNQVKTFFDHYRSHLSNQLNNSACPGAAIIVVKDSLIWFSHMHGLKELGKPDSINEHTVFRIGSLSKGFAAILTGRFVADGQLNWEDTVKEILPYFKLKNQEQTETVEVQHLLSHTIGFPRHMYTNQIENLKSPIEVAEDFHYVYLQGKPWRILCLPKCSICSHRRSLAYS